MNNQDNDVDPQRRGFLKCMTWAGGAMVWTIAGGVPRSRLISSAEAATPSKDFMFVQISDSHLGFDKAANPNTDSHAEGSPRQDRGDAGAPGLHDPHWRYQPSVEAGTIRHGAAAYERDWAHDVYRAGRARHP